MGRGVTVDVDLDFRTDGLYIGSAIDQSSGPRWIGKLYQLTMGQCTVDP